MYWRARAPFHWNGDINDLETLMKIAFEQRMAGTLRERFSLACGGGETHGHTATLSESQLADLIAYLESL